VALRPDADSLHRRSLVVRALERRRAALATDVQQIRTSLSPTCTPPCGSEQANAERKNCYGKNNCSNVDQGDRSVGFGCGRGKHGKEEARRKENCSQ